MIDRREFLKGLAAGAILGTLGPPAMAGGPPVYAPAPGFGAFAWVHGGWHGIPALAFTIPTPEEIDLPISVKDWPAYVDLLQGPATVELESYFDVDDPIHVALAEPMLEGLKLRFQVGEWFHEIKALSRSVELDFSPDLPPTMRLKAWGVDNSVIGQGDPPL